LILCIAVRDYFSIRKKRFLFFSPKPFNGIKFLRSLFLVLEDVPDLLFQIRQFIRGIIPEDRIFDPKIDMSEHIAEPGDFFPVRLRVRSLEIVREIPGCFPNYLEIPDYCIPAPAVRGKFIVRDPACIFLDIADRFEEVTRGTGWRSYA
jgi:hypothetical protein